MSINTFQGIGAILEGHHRVDRSDKNGGQEIHVFAVAGPPPFGDINSRRWDFDVQIPLGPVTFGVKGYIDLDTLTIDAELYVIIPIVGTIPLAELKGNLNDGISVTFGVPGILSGTARLYLKGKTLYLDLSATVFGSEYGPYTIKLFDIPI